MAVRIIPLSFACVWVCSRPRVVETGVSPLPAAGAHSPSGAAAAAAAEEEEEVHLDEAEVEV